MSHELLVIGTDPIGIETALTAARASRRVAIVSNENGELRSGAMFSEAVHELVPEMTVARLCSDGAFRACGTGLFTRGDLRTMLQSRLESHYEALASELAEEGIDVIRGHARFLGRDTVSVTANNANTIVEADHVVVATGTRCARPEWLPFDGTHVVDCDEVLHGDALPSSIIVAGATRAGFEVALLFTAAGASVTIVDAAGMEQLCQTPELDPLLDRAMELQISLRLGDELLGVDVLTNDDSGLSNAAAHLSGGERLIASTLVYAGTRIGNTSELNLDRANVDADERGRLWCDNDFRTWEPHIFGAGQVVGYPVRRDHNGVADTICNAAFPERGVPAPAGLLRSSAKSRVRWAKPL